ncbi:MAG TPA: DUF4738 domain-containing protein [Bacteroidales bacterium]|jgi:hypothetical protein|nr:DUF4738 domain-containing protein [Candidatus Izemoplasmatales bacterium]HOB27447.1 DUF4738 domain-containing protein [Bacteroidales bacterium]HON97762.1 DUF4738 domain-containing protein [Bacteroidales bacterium]HOU82925.1 DUF4738 domain-containing protein [Bacteroidales bacterium]HOV55646.1 DUF4738 domain-containing protein [Bacteroidales bacterium]
MKKTKKTIAMLIIMLVYFQCISMNLQSHKNQNIIITPPPDTIVTYIEDMNLVEPLDTIINNYKIHFYAIKDTGYTVKKVLFKNTLDIENYKNFKIFIEIKKDSNIIYHQYLNKDTFITILKGDLQKMHLNNFRFRGFENDIFKFEISFCIPDTDICYFIAIHINTSGNMKFEEIFYEFEDE